MRKGWPEITLDEVCQFKGGNGFKEHLQGKKTGMHPFIKVSDLTLNGNEKFITGANNWIDESDIKEMGVNLMPPNSVVFAKVGAALKLNKRRILTIPTAIDNNMMAAIPDARRIDPEYLYYFMLTQDLGRFCQESAVPSINQQHMAEILIPLPPLPEQHKIAAILRTWDDAIEKYDDVINIKLRLKNALSIKLLSRKHNKHAPTKLLDDLCDITTGKKDVNEGNPQGIYPFYTCAKETTFSDTYSFDTEAILISGNGVGVGYTHYYNGKFEAYQRTYVLSNFDNKSNIQYILYYLRQYLRQQILKEKQDSAMPYIKLGLLTEFEIPLPEIGQQLKIVSALMAVDEEIDGLRKQQSIIKSQKRGLMQKLLTGEWHVAVDVEAGSKEMAHA